VIRCGFGLFFGTLMAMSSGHPAAALARPSPDPSTANDRESGLGFLAGRE
jgi:hypothetical protein